MIKKYCINCHTLYDTGAETCPNCGFKVTDVKFVMQDGEVLTVNKYAMRKDAPNLSMFDLLNKEIEESPIYKATIDFEKWHAKEQRKLAEYVRKETAREILQKIIDFMEAWTNDQYLPDEIVENIEALEKNIKIGIKETYGVEVE